MKRKRYLAFNFLNIMILLCILACTQQSGPNEKTAHYDRMKDTTKSSLDTAIEPVKSLTDIGSIQRAYNEISTKATAGDFDSTSFKYSCRGEKGGTVSYFTEKGKLRLIVHRYNEYDHYSAEDHYYVKDSLLFFTLRKSVVWAFESGPEGSTKDNIKERRVYLVADKPIKCLEKKFIIRSQATNNPRSEDVPSRNVDCPSPATVMEPYLLLTKYRNNPTKECLDESTN
jgi:hypothetical protein